MSKKPHFFRLKKTHLNLKAFFKDKKKKKEHEKLDAMPLNRTKCYELNSKKKTTQEDFLGIEFQLIERVFGSGVFDFSFTVWLMFNYKE